MLHEIHWNTVEEATSKFGLETALVLKWVEDGDVSAEHHNTRSMRIRVDDLERKLQHVKNLAQSFRDCD